MRKEIYNRYTAKQQKEQQAASAALKRSMTERERESEVIEVDTNITVPSASKKTNRTDLLIKKTSHEDFVAWSEAVLGKGLTFDFISDPLVRKAILLTAQCADSIITFSSSHGKDTILPTRDTWTAKILAATDDRLAFPKVKDADGKMVVPLWKTIKSEFVAWQETIRAKKYDLHDEKQHDQPEGALTERNMNRSKQTWVKTFM